MDTCPVCKETKQLRKRLFSLSAQKALLDWNEIPEEALTKGMCNSCYLECRDILVDRCDELEEYNIV